MDNHFPFHKGEVSIQSRLGVHERVASLGARLIRDHMTDEHAEFFPMLPTLLVGSRDLAGRMWASILCGEPGFVRTAGPRRALISALPLAGDPLAESLVAGNRLGFLGLQFETRRRNRLSGRIDTVTEQGFSLEVDQAYGNCPKYIQTRAPKFLDVEAGVPEQSSGLTDADRHVIEKADTFFIASGIEGDEADPRAGNDISHRGGRPGFVKVEGNTLTWPDFVGNFLFNTLGNLQLDPRAGLLFIDFDSGDTLQLSGRAEVLWDAPYQSGFAGAQRFVRFATERAVRIPSALPLRWTFDQASPFNAKTGVWAEVKGQDIS